MNILRKLIENQKRFYIEKLLEAGVYKNLDDHLYEKTLSELAQVYESYQSTKRK
ncbi:Fur-regulated basic protein FbpA [Ectobacillus antri]|jgi:hypothetical protein|uniref:Fur-regulated basic protein FbpA n=1 Tax=Ectobacillus antri TaxID=2486280 RepID=A0ABT6H180_9BACI|nr:Fur-regulated basic protein FbpA [Ectobacillus antri]MDG4656244.1 Fur-regulated basic protein FbpA [Ectobacillus antri]MDG5752919.1 Fur-regulated basic protein FbpA [Ectobacillus antri]